MHAAVVGLGNPGREYEETRHNIGFQVVDALAGGNPDFEDRGSYIFRGERIAGKRVLLVKPLTFMNRSGLAVARLLGDFSIDIDQILVVSDDVNLPLGRIRLRARGGDGGQKGLRSIIESLGSEDFERLRLGIGTPVHTDSLADFVLAPFCEDERSAVEEMIAQAVDSVRLRLSDGVERAMERFNR